MQYRSTRGRPMQPANFSDVLLGGLAPDGGLVMPEKYVRIDAQTLTRWRELSYADLAFEIVSLYATDIPVDSLRAIVNKAYNADVFGSEDITPTRAFGEQCHLLRLSNGPTLAFKDIAMQLIGGLFEWVLADRGQQINIVGATSGDTGSAAEYAMRGRQGIKVFMLSPDGRMSEFQRAQMFGLNDPNIFNIAVNGVFDDCQDMVKAVSSDLAFKKDYSIGAVNSINFARVLAQSVYYFKAYFAVTENNQQKVSFTVPSGNFGNVLAGHIARSMGLPIDKLVVATNENDVLDEFFSTGVYRVRASAQTHATSSPSMDIGKASNFERFIFDLLDQDTQRLSQLWMSLAQTGQFDLSQDPAFEKIKSFGFVSGRSDHQDRLQTIRRLDRDDQLLVDPHTADGIKVAMDHLQDGVPMICLETALPAKFAQTIHEAVGREPELPAGFDNPIGAAQHYCLMPRRVDLLKDYIAAHVEPTLAD